MRQWEIVGNRSVIDPGGKYWEKYENDPNLIGLYLRMDSIDNFGDFLELDRDGTFKQEEGGILVAGNWKVAGNTLAFTLP